VGGAALPPGILRGLGYGEEPGVLLFDSLRASRASGAVRLSNSYVRH